MLKIGTTLGPYEIISSLGAGGMGEVYRARDTRLDRDVAIKVLPESLARDSHALARFEREAKAVAALSHPNILAVHDVGRHGEVSYVVMELLEGQTLRSRIARGALPLRKAIELGIGIAEGLSAAHAKGVIHRDLKPENIFLTSDGQVKILDFGLARSTGLADGSPQNSASSPTMTLETRPGAIIGTLCYMAPEQVRGVATDPRTDIFAFGCVLYEMLTGRRAFLGETPADTMTAILKEEPKSARSLSSDVPLELDRLIDRCLEKESEQRFQSSRDLAYALRSILAHVEHEPEAARSSKRRFTRPGVAFILLTAVVFGMWTLWRELRHSRIQNREAIDSLAVLPLENVSRDAEQEYFVDGMTEALISDLAKIRSLKVISRTSVMRYKATTKSLPEIAKELNVDAVVEGSVLRVGDRVRVSAQLIHAATDEHLWTESYDRDLSDVLRLQSELARTIAQQIKVMLSPQEQARMAEARPINPEAYQAYLKGRFHWNKRTPDGLKKAIEYFQQAVSLAPDWALGHLGLADTYAVASQGGMRPHEAMPKAKAAAAKALELDEALGEAHATLGFIAEVYVWDRPTAQREFERALVLSPNYATAHHWYGWYLARSGRLDEGLTEMKKAQELDPLSLIISTALARAQCWAGNLAEAESVLRKTLELGPDFAMARLVLAKTLYLQNRNAEALSEAREAVRLSDNSPNVAAYLAYLCGKMGRSEEARRILDEIKGESTKSYVPAIALAQIYEGLGETDTMFEWLEKAYQERDAGLIVLLIDPSLAPVRSDTRFIDLVRRVGLPPLPVTGGRDAGASPLTKGGNRGVDSGKIMLAVLPFENLSRDPEQDYFSDGLTEEMITQLGRINPQKLGVIARSSAMHYKNTDRSIPHVRSELGVDYVVEGSVRRHDDQIRMTARLVDTRSQAQIWADSFAPEVKNLLVWQSTVAQAIAKEIKVTLTPQEQSRTVESRPVNPAAFEAYLKGRFHWNKRNADGLKKAVEHFEQAISLAPDWPLGYAGLADAYAVMPQFASMRPSEVIPKARAAAAKALEIDESLAEAHATMAAIATRYDWNWPIAEAEYERAIALNPNYATAHHYYATHLMWIGRHDESIREITKAQELDPLSLVIAQLVGVVHYYAGDLAQAETQLRKALELGPEFADTHKNLARTFFSQGRLAEAITEGQEAVRLSNNDPWYVATLGYVYAKSGQAEEARRILDELTARSANAFVAPSHFALVHAGLDERDRVFEWLEKAYQERDVLLMLTLRDPLLAPLRSDPRFADLVRRVGLPMPKSIPTAGPSVNESRGGSP